MILNVLLTLACAGAQQVPASAPSSSRNPLVKSLAGRLLVYAHLAPTVDSGNSVTDASRIGVVEDLPTVQSTHHEVELVAARAKYEAGRFLEAAQLMEAALKGEPDNPFLLNEYARALFRVDSLRPQSRVVYEKLVTLLGTQQSASAQAVVVDLWFVDASWKLGMLYLDGRQYDKALIELAKVALAPQPHVGLREQVYAYLAETYFNLGDQAAAEWFVDRTLEMNPHNEYVLQFRGP